MTEPYDLHPDTEEGLKQYLRNSSVLTALVGSRILFGVPKNDPTFPLVTIARIGGGDDPSCDAPLDYAVININCWGRSKEEAWNVASATRSAVRRIRERVVYGGVALLGGLVDSVLWLPDPADARPRYILTCRIVAAAVDESMDDLFYGGTY